MTEHLDYLVSKYVRKSQSVNGKTKCFFCNLSYDWQNMDTMHFRKRRHLCTRWDLENLYPGCRKCHTKHGEDDLSFGMLLDAKFGEGFADKLRFKSNQTCKLSKHEIKELINHFETLLNVEN